MRLPSHNPRLFLKFERLLVQGVVHAAIRRGGRDSESYRGIVLSLRGEAPYLKTQPGYVPKASNVTVSTQSEVDLLRFPYSARRLW
jgi:hypothetical protein